MAKIPPRKQIKDSGFDPAILKNQHHPQLYTPKIQGEVSVDRMGTTLTEKPSHLNAALEAAGGTMTSSTRCKGTRSQRPYLKEAE